MWRCGGVGLVVVVGLIGKRERKKSRARRGLRSGTAAEPLADLLRAETRSQSTHSFLSLMSASIVQRVLLLVGPPGSGKSTFAKSLVRVVPVIARARWPFVTLEPFAYHARSDRRHFFIWTGLCPHQSG